MENNTMHLIAGLDVGNGYVKAQIRNQVKDEKPSNVDFLSGCAYVTNSHNIKTSLQDANDLIADIFNQMDVSFTSPLVKDMTRRLFGKRGVLSGMSLDEFDVYSHVSKAQQDLSAILVLGSIAGKALQDYWKEHHALPKDPVDVCVKEVSLALPIAEFKKYRKEYARGFKEQPHMVSFHNFEQIIYVNIAFEDVQVLAEGESAQYAIISKGEPLMNSMLADVRKLGDDNLREMLAGITAKDVLSATNTVGVDIGEGTVNFPVFQNGKFNPDSSITFDKGYGSVLNNALDRLQESGYPFRNRKELADFLQTQPTAMIRARYYKVKAIVDEEVVSFANEVSMQFVKVMSRIGAYIEVVYIYGGGATPVKEVLHPLLVNTATTFGDGIPVPTLYLDSRYSRYLNREGLYIVANKLVERVPVGSSK